MLQEIIKGKLWRHSRNYFVTEDFLNELKKLDAAGGTIPTTTWHRFKDKDFITTQNFIIGPNANFI